MKVTISTGLSRLAIALVFLLIKGCVATEVVEVEIRQGTIMSASKDPPSSFPSLNGVEGEEAKKIIEKEFPSLSVQVVPEDSMVTMDFREDRVRIFVNADGKVARAPMLG